MNVIVSHGVKGNKPIFTDGVYFADARKVDGVWVVYRNGEKIASANSFRAISSAVAAFVSAKLRSAE